MNVEHRYREFLPEARRVVIKIGTRVIAQKTGRPDMPPLRSLVKQVAELHRKGYEVLLVSSGAIGAGVEALGMKARPTSVPDLQMCAAVGQARLMAHYEELFSAEKIVIGQVLLTHADFQNRIRFANAKRTMAHMLQRGVIPIINENDAVADEEIKADLSLGDNDYLAALVVKLTRADLLIILSTVDGLLDAQGHRVHCIENLSDAFALVKPLEAGGLSKGGMDSKLRAAQLAVKACCSVVIAGGRQKKVLTDIMAGNDAGTLILGSAL
ncbi:MAG: glutamate 5-kinase [Verrucomicrobiota bacterium]|jgi:glutamate 5-kinase|nr:glutamate 5-kinase [Verrucomicrobiota bacterium]